MSNAKKKPCKVGENKTEIVRDVPLACAHESHAVEFLERLRWGDDPRCPECTSRSVYRMTKRGTTERESNHRWRCRDCGRLYSVRLGTVMEESRIPLRHWCYAFWAACASKKGVSAKQIQRQTGLSYKSALFLMHRVRFAMAATQPGKLGGVVEADETFVGGKPRHRVLRGKHRGRKLERGERIKHDRKQPIFAAVSRDSGMVRTRVVPDVTAETLQGALDDLVERSSHLVTDEAGAYKGIGKEFASHRSVSHSNAEYVRGDVTTNTIEGFFSLLKRGIYGTFHNVSREHLHRYCDEFAFRYNTRTLDDGERTRLAVQGSIGKRLVQRQRTMGE